MQVKPAAPAPPAWCKSTLPDGRPFWRCPATNEVSFVDPNAHIASDVTRAISVIAKSHTEVPPSIHGPPLPKSSVPPSVSPPPPLWLPVSHQGQFYYYNTATGVTQWEVPPELNQQSIGTATLPQAHTQFPAGGLLANQRGQRVGYQSLISVRVPPQGHGITDFTKMVFTSEGAVDQGVQGFHNIIQQKNLATANHSSYTIAFATPVTSCDAWYECITAMGITLHPADGGAPAAKVAPYAEPNKANSSMLSWKVVYGILPMTHVTFEYVVSRSALLSRVPANLSWPISRSTLLSGESWRMYRANKALPLLAKEQ